MFFGCKAHGNLAPQPGIKPTAPALEVQSLNHWSAKEIHVHAFLIFLSLFFSFLPLPFLPPSPFPILFPPPPPSSSSSSIFFFLTIICRNLLLFFSEKVKLLIRSGVPNL